VADKIKNQQINHEKWQIKAKHSKKVTKKCPLGKGPAQKVADSS
jgi:hypothetical protein